MIAIMRRIFDDEYRGLGLPNETPSTSVSTTQASQSNKVSPKTTVIYLYADISRRPTLSIP